MTRRTISEWGSQPEDGTPFHILNTLRFNPLAQRYEALCHSEKGMCWTPVSFGDNAPSKWLRLAPLPYELPTSFAFTLTYTCEPRRRSFSDRVFDRLMGWLGFCAHETMAMRWLTASGMETRRAETENTGSVAKP